MRMTCTTLFRISLITACLVVSACQSEPPKPEPLVQTPALPSSDPFQVNPTETPVAEPTVDPRKVLILDDFDENSILCKAEPSENTFSVDCSEKALSISQADNRRNVDILITREMPVEVESFSLEMGTASFAAEKGRADQNGHGFYFVDGDGLVHALRLSAQYFSFETWSRDVEIKVEESTNPSFSPAIKSSGQGNTFRLDCSADGCDLYANGVLAGRSPVGISGKTKMIGGFASSNWDQHFGKVEFRKLRIYELETSDEIKKPYSIEDPLTSGGDIFAGTGLSGAFHNYGTDGFHFSPVIPYGYYGVKAGPALESVSVKATIKMEINPGISGSRFAGLACHSSLDGMIMAVIRVDGTFSIYRDTPSQPFALLAQKASDAILPGLAENNLRLDCIGDQITFFINGAQVESLTNTRYGLRYGRAGLFTKAGGTPDSDAIIFSDFGITEIR